jgi:hypothetical protein
MSLNILVINILMISSPATYTINLGETLLQSGKLNPYLLKKNSRIVNYAGM